MDNKNSESIIDKKDIDELITFLSNRGIYLDNITKSEIILNPLSFVPQLKIDGTITLDFEIAVNNND